MRTHLRVERDTRRAFAALLVVSVILHLVLTPFAGWIALFDQWFRAPVAEEPAEQLRQIPIELFEPPGEAPTEGSLPDEDPVAMIDELLVAPEKPAGDVGDSPPTVEPEPTAPERASPPEKKPA